MNHSFPTLTPDEAASLIKNGETIGFSGFTPAGAAKVVPKALAARAKAEHAAGRPFKVAVVTGASTKDIAKLAKNIFCAKTTTKAASAAAHTTFKGTVPHTVIHTAFFAIR